MIVISRGKLRCTVHNRYCDKNCTSFYHFESCPTCKYRDYPSTSEKCNHCQVGDYFINWEKRTKYEFK